MRAPVSHPKQQVFGTFAPPCGSASALRATITAATRHPEDACVWLLAKAAQLEPGMRSGVAATARALIEALRGKKNRSIVEELVQEYSLSTQEGVALMCLAEALLRIPDTATRDALIRDKIAGNDWAAHLGATRSLFVNAATWGLAISGKLATPVHESSLAGALTRVIARCGEPVIRRGVDLAMRMMGQQFVMGQTIDAALKRAKELEAKGFAYSYDMLGEAAMTAADASHYLAAYEAAIHAIGASAAASGSKFHDRPGISIKLSALHPRYARAQLGRVMGELLPRVAHLAALAKRYDIGLNIDAEEADRLELSLDLIENLAQDPALLGWNGLGFVVQAYGKRCPYVIDFLIDLSRRAGRRLMVRLVKGAYWDAEIKRAQVDGLEGYPVFTCKSYTDVSYIACAKKLLAARDAVFPQFATHNAQTLATIYHLAGPEFTKGDYEFQCLHGMGEPLYEEVVGADKLARPCRIYAPVGTHETLLAYLVRRLLENGANSSFVNRIADPAVSIDALIVDPAEEVLALTRPGSPHEAIALPGDILAPRLNSSGLDLASESTLAMLTAAFETCAKVSWRAGPPDGVNPARILTNPADSTDCVGLVREMTPDEALAEVSGAALSIPAWAATSVETRAACLELAADMMQARMPNLMGLIMREAGKTASNAIAEVREAIDFLRYYAQEARQSLVQTQPLGLVACISPWNFPLAIFAGQVAAALVAGNAVVAKPAEETPLIAAEAVRLLHEAGVPASVLRLVTGDGTIGATLVGAPAVQGVVFTGSTTAARLIQKSLAKRLTRMGRPVPLIAETGGLNAMIVDSSALPEQVVGDVLASAFDSAGQRCSALRLLCLQEDVADRTLEMLKGAVQELRLGSPLMLASDIGPVISDEARQGIEAHVAAMSGRGFRVTRHEGPVLADGFFVKPTIIEIDRIEDLEREIFGPVLHVLRYARKDLELLIKDINHTGFGLTFGLHTRIDETIRCVTSEIEAGNIYINRNIIGATVGVQPFGGRGLSGTGPKAGGPLYLSRFVTDAPLPQASNKAPAEALAYIHWLETQGLPDEAAYALSAVAQSPAGLELAMPGPVGETNAYHLSSRGTFLLYPQTKLGLYRQLAQVLACGNRAVIDAEPALLELLRELPSALAAHVEPRGSATEFQWAGVLVEGEGERVLALLQPLAEQDGPLVVAQAATTQELSGLKSPYNVALMVEESHVSTNTTAAGGNASLMALE